MQLDDEQRQVKKMMKAADYRFLSELTFKEGYPGYQPTVQESPNGDGYWDADKNYAHIAMKYLKEYTHPDVEELYKYLNSVNNKAVEVAIELGVPREFWPSEETSAIRILEYPPSAVAHPHTDFSLFTLMCYRNIRDCFVYDDEANKDDELREANYLNYQIHFGEMLELILPCYPATPHEVIAEPSGKTQYSIVYFAIPNREVVLPTGYTVGEFIDERIGRSRKTVEA